MFLTGFALGALCGIASLLVVGMLVAAKDYDDFDRYY